MHSVSQMCARRHSKPTSGMTYHCERVLLPIGEPRYVDRVLGCSTSSSTGGVCFGTRHRCKLAATAGDHENDARDVTRILPGHSNATIASLIDANASGLCWLALTHSSESKKKQEGGSKASRARMRAGVAKQPKRLVVPVHVRVRVRVRVMCLHVSACHH